MTLAEMYMQAGMEKEAAAAGKAGPGLFSTLKGQAGDLADVVRGRHPAASPSTVRNARIGTGVAGAAVLGGGALALKKLMSRKSMGQRLVGAMKKNRKALIGGGAAAGGLAGLAAYRKNQGK